MTVTSDRHAAQLVFQTVNKPSAEYMRLSWMPLGAEVAPGSSITCGNLFLPGNAAGNGIGWITDVSWAAEHLGLGGGIRRWVRLPWRDLSSGCLRAEVVRIARHADALPRPSQISPERPG
jgi:hypothetical protein